MAVLTWDGRVADNFAWHDPDDQRVPLEMLTSEGVEFDSSARASQGQRLSPDDLQALIGWFDPDDDVADDDE